MRRTSVTIPGTSLSGRGSAPEITSGGSRKLLAVAISARNGPLMLTLNLNGMPAIDRISRCVLVLPSPTPSTVSRVANSPSRIAVEADDHRLEPQVAQRVERQPADHPGVGLVDHAIVSERPAARPAVEPPADDPPAALVEDHRQHAVEHAGRADFLEPHRVDEGLGVEPDHFERQSLGGRPVEVEHRLLEDQPPAHERPFAAFDADQPVGQQR